MDSLISVNKLTERIRTAVEELGSVQAAYIYGGEFEQKHLDIFKGSVEYGTTCLVTAMAGDIELDKTLRTINNTVNFSIFIIGINDINIETSIANSTDCLKTIDELSVLIMNNSFDHPQMLRSKINGWQQVENTIEENKRVNIYMLDFELTFKTNINNNQYLI